MSAANDGGPAFPQHIGHVRRGDQGGMTLRDYFAAAALNGLLAGYLNRANLDTDGALMIPNSMHTVAYNCADEMLRVRGGDK